MDFGGDLSVLDPSIVFQIFNMSGLTGELKFISPESVVSIFFREGDLVYATIDTSRKKKIGRFLIDRGLINEDQLNEALKEFRKMRGRERIGHILMNRGYLDYNSLASAIQEQMKEVVYNVLKWDRGQFIFFKNVYPEDEDILLDIKMDHLILEGLRRLDEG